MEIIKKIFTKKMLVIVALGFASGVPFLVTKDILKAWMTDSNVDLGTIGLFSGLALPYTLKFLWAPFTDRFTPSFLGRRRGWILIAQIGVIISIALLGQFDPKESLLWIAIMSLAVTFFSATQDIVIDAHRREFLDKDELGFGSGLYMNTYRGANLACLAVGFLVAEKVGYQWAHIAIAGLMVFGIIGVLLSPEPKVTTPPPRSMKEAVIDPFKEFFSRKGAFLILAFILFYKIGDNMASAMNVPFILKMGFTKSEYLVIVKGLGLGSLFAGMLLGGAVMIKLGLYWSLVIFGLLQMISTGGFAVLALVGQDTSVLTAVVVFELLATGLGTTAYATFMALQTNTRFTATQYALFTSLMAVPGTVVAMGTGYLAEALGWQGFYVVCMLAAIPGLLLITKVCTKDMKA